MDSSKEYIEMCAQAGEIQNLCGYKEGDWFDSKHGAFCSNGLEDKYIGDYYITKDSGIKEYKEDACVWLPRQDQLQEMINWDYSLGKQNDKWFASWVYNAHKENLIRQIYSRDSAEIILLEMVMKDKFNKVWNKEKGEWE